MTIYMTIYRLLLASLLFCLAATEQPAWGQSKVDYKAVPIMQAMKTSAPTPDFTLATPDGKRISLKQFRGKVGLL